MTRGRLLFLMAAGFASLRAVGGCAASGSDVPVEAADASRPPLPEASTNDDHPTVDGSLDLGFDLGHGEWKTEQVSTTEGTISHDARLAFLPNGTLVAAWSEPDSKVLSIQNIATATFAGGAWPTATMLTNDTNTQNAFPSLATDDAKLHLVWNAYSAGDNDLFYRRLENGAWSAKTDLTSRFEPSTGVRSDYGPTIARGPKGELAIVYSSQPSTDAGVPNGKADVRVLRLQSDGTPNGPPEIAIPQPVAGECYNPTLSFDGAGHLYVAADCGAIGGEDIALASDVGGTWTLTTLPGSGRDDDQPTFALDADGVDLYLAWVGYSPCATSANSCGDILVAKVAPGAPGPEAKVTDTPDENENTPRAVIDRYGRLIVGYTHFNAANFADVYLSWSSGKSGFSAPRNLTPGTDAQDDTGLSSFALEPKTGVPHLLYHSVLSGTDPLNSEIMHTFFVPALLR